MAQIAQDAGVTERTFFRYFPTKEAVLFKDYESRLRWFEAALAERPLDEPILDSVLIAISSFPDDREVLHQLAALRDGLSRAAIEGHLRVVQASFARELEDAIRIRLAQEQPVTVASDSADRLELTAVVLGNAIAGALLGALDVWTRRGGTPDGLEPLTRQALDVLRRFPAG